MKGKTKYSPDFDSELLRKGGHYVVASDLYKANGAVLYFAGSIIKALLENDYKYDCKGIGIDVETELCASIFHEAVVRDLIRSVRIEAAKEKGSEWCCSITFIGSVRMEGTKLFFKPLFNSGSEELVFMTDMLGEEISKILDERKKESDIFESLSPVDQFAYQLGFPVKLSEK